MPKNRVGQRFRTLLLLSTCLGVTPGFDPGFAQSPSAPATTKQDEQNPAEKKEEAAIPGQPVPAAVVIEVEGSVDWALTGVSPLAKEGWTAVKKDDRLEPGTQIRTGLRSHVNLRFGETTVMSVRSATHASIDQFYRSATTERVNVGLAYGTVRGGSIESTIHSDVQVDSTVATLAKRGTEGWEMRVEPMTGRYRISLAESGLIEAMQKVTAGRQISKEVRPGEYATQDNIANLWINQNVFDRTIQFYEASSVTEADASFSTVHSTGYGTLAPGGGSSVRETVMRTSADFVSEQTTGRDGGPPSTVVIDRSPIRGRDGDFGTGTTLKVLLPTRDRRVGAANISRMEPNRRVTGIRRDR